MKSNISLVKEVAKRNKLFVVLISILVLGSHGIANASSYAEIGDAGRLPSIAQITTGNGTLTSITGSLTDKHDVDMFKIHLTGEFFSADTWGSDVGDPILYLFSDSGRLKLVNDDFYQNNYQSFICGTLQAGDYYLTIVSWNNEPMSGSFTFPHNNDPNDWPHDRGIDNWSDNGDVHYYGNYTITLTGATAAMAEVPEPATMLLLGLGLAGLAGVRRKVKK